MPCPKIGYPNQEIARYHLSLLAQKPGRKEKSHYLCPQCFYYHLSSDTKAHKAKNTKSDKPTKPEQTFKSLQDIPQPKPSPLIKEMANAKPLTPTGVANFYFQYSYENDKRRKNAKNYSL